MAKVRYDKPSRRLVMRETVASYLFLLPFLLLIIFQGANCVRLFREYRAEEMAVIRAEREKLKEEREATRRMLEELDRWKERSENARTEGEGTGGRDDVMAGVPEEDGEKGEWVENEDNGEQTQKRSRQ